MYLPDFIWMYVGFISTSYVSGNSQGPRLRTGFKLCLSCTSLQKRQKYTSHLYSDFANKNSDDLLTSEVTLPTRAVGFSLRVWLSCAVTLAFGLDSVLPVSSSAKASAISLLNKEVNFEHHVGLWYSMIDTITIHFSKSFGYLTVKLGVNFEHYISLWYSMIDTIAIHLTFFTKIHFNNKLL